MTTGFALTTLRFRAGLTGSEVARAAGTTVRVVKLLEQDRRPWDAALGTRLLTALASESDLAILNLLAAQQTVDAGGRVVGVPVPVH